jgi:hypothetical protein
LIAIQGELAFAHFKERDLDRLVCQKNQENFLCASAYLKSIFQEEYKKHERKRRGDRGGKSFTSTLLRAPLRLAFTELIKRHCRSEHLRNRYRVKRGDLGPSYA